MSAKLPEKRPFSPLFGSSASASGETTPLLERSVQDASYEVEPIKNPFVIDDLEYTPEEEAAVLWKLDRYLMPCILVTTFVLNMDRTNNSNAISDNLPDDLGFDINVVNTATAMYSVLFATACLSGAIIAKIVGPARCEWLESLFSTSPLTSNASGIPTLMFSWGLVTLAHVLITDKTGYITGE